MPERGDFNFTKIDYEAKQADIDFVKSIKGLDVKTFEKYIDNFDKCVGYSDDLMPLKKMLEWIEDATLKPLVTKPVKETGGAKGRGQTPKKMYDDAVGKVYEYWKKSREKKNQAFLRKFWKKTDNALSFRQRNQEGYKLRRQRNNPQEKVQKLKSLRDEMV